MSAVIIIRDIPFKAGGSTAAVSELNRKLTDSQKDAEQLKQQLDQTKDEAKRLTTETERLLQLVQMSQEEQAQKEKQIMDLQQLVTMFQIFSCVFLAELRV